MNKNTLTTRTVQSINTRFNIYFNGKVSYDEGIKAINDANKDDYSQIIPMYPISRHENAKTATSNFDRTIEKCRKAIKTRSIKTKPESVRKKKSTKSNKSVPIQEEYNPFMPEVWLLLAKAEFHKADFLGAVGTFNYIIRHFKENEGLGLTCQLWVIRSYAELGWLYEAEEMLSKINQKNLTGENISLYSAVYADLLLKRHQYREAIPFLEKVLEKEKDKTLKMRFTFLLAQLYQSSGNKQKAYDLYSQLIKKNPPYEMDFNARISRAGLFLGNVADTRKELNRMIKNFNNRDYLDQLYFTLGKSYLHTNDTVKALQNFQEAVDNSTRNGLDKAAVLITMGDIYYKKKEYIKAQPCYDEASKIISIDSEDYPRVFNRSEMLSELVVHYDMVQLQDSLQRLSKMSEEDRLKSIKAYIAKLEQEEKLAAEREEKMKLRQEANQERAEQVTFMSPAGGGINPQGEWYFYNPNLIRSGQTEFQRKWGRRKLEDNWRRLNKSAVLFAENHETTSQPETNIANDSIAHKEGEIAQSDPAETTDEVLEDSKNPTYYLKQIPVTKEQIELSNQLWADALYNVGLVYEEKLNEYQLATLSFQDYLNRFEGYKMEPDVLYQLYMSLIKQGRKDEAESVRLKLIEKYSDLKYAQILSNPNYVETKQQMLVEQDSIYRVTYEAFNKNDFELVFKNVQKVEEQYPMSDLMPKFLFLKALSIGKNKNQKDLEEALNKLLADYPNSDVSSISKDILALIMQGREAQQGTTQGSLLARREEQQIAILNGDSVLLSFSPDKETMHRVLLITSEPEESMFELQFQLAVYNFSKFLLKDFELNISKIDNSRNALFVYEFDNYEDAAWYLQAIAEDEEIAKLLKKLKAFPLVMSEHNFGLLRNGFTLDDYLTFKVENDKTVEENKN
ncbi:hypothetical protein MASR2M117_21850 [Paludibacter sp.]